MVQWSNQFLHRLKGVSTGETRQGRTAQGLPSIGILNSSTCQREASLKKTYTKPTWNRIDRLEDPWVRIGALAQTDSTIQRPSGKKLIGAKETPRLPHQSDLDPLVAISADIVSAYISNNPLPVADLPNFIGQIYSSLKVISVATPTVRSGELKPAVPVKNSVTSEFIICLEDGKRFKSLKRHIGVHFGLTPDQYRARWNLPSNYPMGWQQTIPQFARHWPNPWGSAER